MKNIILTISLLCGFVFAQDLPGLGLYVGGIYGSAGGPVVDNLPTEVEVKSNMGLPMAGVSYAMMAGPVPLFMGAGLGVRTYKLELTADASNYNGSTTLSTVDGWVTVPYPVTPDLNIYGGLLFGKVLSGSSTTVEAGVETTLDFTDEMLPEGIDYGLVFGVGYALPVMDKAIALNAGYALGLAENKADGQTEGMKFNGLFLSVNYDIPGM